MLQCNMIRILTAVLARRLRKGWHIMKLKPTERNMKTIRNETRIRDVLPGLLLIGVTIVAVTALALGAPRRIANASADEVTIQCAQAFAGQTFSFPGR